MAIDSAKTIVIVTGANRGIGYEIVAALLRAAPSGSSRASGAPYHVYLGSRSLDKGQAALASLKPEYGNSVSLLYLDVTSADSIAAAVSKVESETGRVDNLINNVGIVSTASDSISRLRETLEVNLVAPYAVTEAFRALLLVQPASGDDKEKLLIHVTSDLGSIGMRTDPSNKLYNSPFPEYRISKAAINMMAACHQHELLNSGAKVFAFNPGYAATDLTGDAEARRRRGARDPKVVGEACVKIVEGRRDGDVGLLLDVEGVLPW
ncbi:hypothetical protein VTN77DRAFT_1451 [Rasamsonia byssochlamydoides]|uniref:uncharacterized protein n=1 Tax=Rasamsonia byssochlamydoides TaxID=89139 RepID=UPI0037420A9A